MINVFTIIAALAIAGFFSFIVYLCMKEGVIDTVIRRIYNNFWNHYLKRKRIAKISENYYGAVNEKGLLTKIDKKISASGLRDKYSYLSAELYIAISLLSSMAAGGVYFLIFHNFLWSILFSVIVFLTPWFILYFAEGIRYKKTERQLLVFINLLENYSRTSDDLVDIILKTEMYLEEPLKSSIRKFAWEAKNTGEIDIAIKHLVEKNSDRKFKEIIQNLEICRKHDTNYEDVLEDIRVSTQEYLRSKEEKMSLRQNTRANIIIMMLVGGVIVRLVNGFVEGGLLRLLMSGAIGILIVTYIVVVLLIGVWQIVKIDKN